MNSCSLQVKEKKKHGSWKVFSDIIRKRSLQESIAVSSAVLEKLLTSECISKPDFQAEIG